MDNTFWYALTVEMRKKVNEMEILKQNGSILSHPIRCLGVSDRTAVRGCVDTHVDIGVYEGSKVA